MNTNGEEESEAGSQPAQRDDRDNQGGQNQGGRPARNRAPANAQELLTDEIKIRSGRANQLLRSCLNGKVIFKIDGANQSYLIDWSGEKLEAGPTNETEADCVITLSEQNLMKIASGDLNPQVAMLSDKIKVSGKLGLAVYIFNLIGARSLMI